MSDKLTDKQLTILESVKQGDISSFYELLIELKNKEELAAITIKIILCACQFDRVEILQILIDNNYSLMVCDEQGNTPCLIAVQFLKTRVLKFVLNNGHYSLPSTKEEKDILVTLALKNSDYTALECLKDKSIIDEIFLTNYLEKFVSETITSIQNKTPVKSYQKIIELLLLLGTKCTDNVFKIAEENPKILRCLYPDYLNELKDLLDENDDIIRNILALKLYVPENFICIDPINKDKLSLLKWLENEFETIISYYEKKDIFPVIKEIREMLENTKKTRFSKEKYQSYREIDSKDIKLQEQLIHIVKNLWKIHQVIQHKELYNQSLFSGVKLEIYASNKHHIYTVHYKLNSENLFTEKEVRNIKNKEPVIPPFFNKKKKLENKTLTASQDVITIDLTL